MENNLNTTQFKQLFGYNLLPDYEGLIGKLPIPSKKIIFGVEVELEKVHLKTGYSPATWTTVEDLSLKLDGLEFVSIPLKMEYLEVELRRLSESIEKYITSLRCSVHVHMNARDMNEKELYVFTILYCIFERSLFRFSGDRWKNNFCTPLTMSPNIVKNFSIINNRAWYKYFALNLCPIWGDDGSKKIGTIEFRHLSGTLDIERIMSWCSLIAGLKLASKTMSVESVLEHIKVMNTTSGYYWLADEVFGNWKKLITDQKTFKQDVEECISMCKFIFLTPKHKAPKIQKAEEIAEAKQKVVFDDFLFTQPPPPKITPSLDWNTHWVTPTFPPDAFVYKGKVYQGTEEELKIIEKTLKAEEVNNIHDEINF